MPEAVAALEQQCQGIAHEQACSKRVAAALTWLTKGLEHKYGPLVMEQAKAKFAMSYRLHTIELVLMKWYFIRFHSWEPGDWWIADCYLDYLASSLPQIDAHQAVLDKLVSRTDIGYSPVARYIHAFWQARRIAVDANQELDLSRFTKPKDDD